MWLFFNKTGEVIEPAFVVLNLIAHRAIELHADLGLAIEALGVIKLRFVFAIGDGRGVINFCAIALGAFIHGEVYP